ncbi:serine hydrolase domain-containing protein [Flavobacterium sp. ST-75]|uniref:Serine hydrolase domain-containing protein n=1 Tax=Flavobacterium rhizophilum TaxID=3163296 RepID=A0ABW8Y8H2_9FLAO
MKKISALLLMLLPLIAFSQNNFKAIDSVLSVYDQGIVPGVSVSIAKNGKVIYSRNVGYADIEASKKIDDKTLFCMASVSKQITAACIVLLEQQGKLSLEDKLSKYFPDFPEYANTVSIVHLLNHTSGIKDYIVLSMLKGDDYMLYNDKDMYDILKRQNLDFEPGSEYSYSNSGYWFLVRIIEKISGKSIIDFAQENIFLPLEMNNTKYTYDSYSVENMSKGYVETDEGYEIAPQKEGLISGAGIVSSVYDMQKWLFEMHTQKVFGTAFWDIMLNKKVFEIGKDDFYTKGLAINVYLGEKRIEHGGDVDGFHTLTEYFPEQELTVVIFSNNDQVSINQINKTLLSIFFKRTFSFVEEEEKNKKVNGVKLTEAELKKYIGGYVFSPYSFNVSIKEGELFLVQEWNGVGYSVLALGEDKFADNDNKGVLFTFSDIKNDSAGLLVLNQNGKKYEFERKPEFQDVHEFVGSYYSAVLDVTYNFILEEGDLWFVIGSEESVPLLHQGKDRYVSPFGNLIFKRDKKSKLTGFSFSHDRARNIEFVKVPATE